MLSDLRFAFRQLVKSPGFTAIAALTLALGIGMNTAMFSVLNGLLLRPLSYPQVERLFRLGDVRPHESFGDHASADFADIARDGADVAELAAFRFWAFTLSEPNQPADVPIALRVTANYFDVLRKPPELGRGFSPDEATAGKDGVIVLSHRYWQSHFGGDPHIVGRVVRLDGEPTEVIGVLPAEDDTVRLLAPVGIYRPLVWTEAEQTNRTDKNTGVIGRYRDGVTTEQAAVRFQTIARRLAADHPGENKDMTLVTQSLQSTVLTGTGLTMTLLLVGLSGFVLLIACANLANMLLARALARAREFSIRAALGASRAHLVKPLAAESVLLAGAGGAAATLVAMWTSDWLAGRFGGPDNPVDFSIDLRVLAFALAASVGTAFLFGVGPAWWAARVAINDALKNSSRGSSGNRSQHRFRQALIVTQVALTLVLLAGAGFFVRGLERLVNAHTGWNPDPVISGVLNLASAKYSTAEPIIAFHTQLRDRLRALPGVENASVSFEVPLFNPPARRGYLVEGREPTTPGQEATAFTNGVSASFFDTVGLRLRRGRVFDDTDQLHSPPVVVINDAMARALFPGEEAIGHRLAIAGQPAPDWAEIVGVVEDVRTMNVTPSPFRFQVYKPFAQEAWQYVNIAVRAADRSKAPALIEPIRRTVAALDPDQPIQNLMPVPERIERNFDIWETINRLLFMFAGLGLLLAALGIYGVVSRLVAQRTTEIGIRMALGAQGRDILRLVVGGGVRTALVGIAVGVVGATYLGHYLTIALPAFGGNALQPVALTSAVLVVVGLLACYLPARRATRVDPLVALRAE